jgi:hypothetical protein
MLLTTGSRIASWKNASDTIITSGEPFRGAQVIDCERETQPQRQKMIATAVRVVGSNPVAAGQCFICATSQ